MGILEILFICIISFAAGDMSISFNNNNVTGYHEVMEAGGVKEVEIGEKEEIIMKMPPSYYELVEENEKLGMIIMGLLIENKECFDRDI